MKILIVANGTIKNWPKLEIDRVIAADGGADHCIKFDVEPYRVVGDLDSISKRAKKKFKDIIIQNMDQNFTDLQKAIRIAQSLKPSEVTVIGAIGHRLDHTIGNIIALDNVDNSKIIDEHNEIYLIKDNIELTGKKGDIVSIIAITDVTGLTYEGLKWKVKNKNVSSGWSGTCNEMKNNHCKISLKGGKIIVIKARD